MAQLLLARHQRRRTRQALSLQIRLGKFFLMFSMLIIGGFMSMLYLMNFTDVHTKGYEVTQLEGAREELVTQHEIKTMNLARVRSLSHIQGSSTVQRMIPARDPIYIVDTPVARR